MKLILAAIGRQKSGPETELLDRYLDRARKAGRSLGFTQIDVIELMESRAKSTEERKTQEAEQLLKALPSSCYIIALDEHGKHLPSPDFAKIIDRERGSGHSAIALVIGGPDGHGPALLKEAKLKLALGAMTWPHQIARMLIAEQLYRAMTILTGHPYHRS
ncbi:MAG: 23S rRNA (pseudouridine(1915)-N(3))-methyltransferase RlmH [Cohaesibacter sp.]|jgi:23S rRNA (pseudouridine1915-N3)-methyltransferase|nr:23S rRNA (pseudouridine(1915)-N(3))-methyltransferase RlmH [Cohaesibacter sp.]